MTALSSAGLTDVGRQRKHNEDTIVFRPEMSFFAVCDGVGGANAGEVASAMAGEHLVAGRQRAEQDLGRLTAGSQEAVQFLVNSLVASITSANQAVVQRAAANEQMRGMASTVVAASITGARAIVAHVGDSRAYLLRDGRLVQVTEDHSWGRQMVLQGRLREDELDRYAHKNYIVRAVGQQATIQVETQLVELQQDDMLLLCSDGLSDMVADPLIEHTLRNHGPEAAVPRLIDMANQNGGKDNVTVLVVRYGENAAELELDDRDAIDSAPTREDDATASWSTALGQLRSFDLFAGLTFDELNLLLPLVDEIPAPAGQKVMFEGLRGSQMYLVLEGNLGLSLEDTRLVTLGPGEFFGELALLDGEALRPATVTAESSCRLLVIDRAGIDGLLEQHPATGQKVLRNMAVVLSRQVAASYEDLLELKSGS